jgi:hemerythrin-like domain-containing protein
MIRIDLQNIKNGTINLILNEVDFIQKADTYYYAIDKHLNKDNDSTYKVLNNLKQLFLKWDSCLKVAFNEGCKYIYLPFDFTDRVWLLRRSQRLFN